MTQTLLSNQDYLPHLAHGSDGSPLEPAEAPLAVEGLPRPMAEGVLTLSRPLRPAPPRPKGPAEPLGPQNTRDLRNWLQGELERLSKQLCAAQAATGLGVPQAQEWLEVQRKLGSILRTAEVQVTRTRS